MQRVGPSAIRPPRDAVSRDMRSVSVSVSVSTPREDVFAYLDDIANHESFTDHMLVDWSCWGPTGGAGARARMRVRKPGPRDWIDLEVIESKPPTGSTEESVSGGGRRRTRGTYQLEELPEGGTRITFEVAWLRAPFVERLAAPLTRAVVRRGNQRALNRLAEQLRTESAPHTVPSTAS
jgi:hypothetical protein